ncbi:Peptidase M13 [Alteracholeplasma palmae J233]|uniref:Peptidase M13 n=1 Tax=Alteracholeplasma palmae (strain ATCC 49389 / J233) TaxID=1318466 RepID=U4KS13_ALTPJ|nr:M13 family metallopeptidase [Alteracholeplasma palmae]CCV64626.1 Peptidase M13 [Alteracholeplasma palmae J233]
MKKVRLEDDFYQFQNGEWLEKTEIPSDKPLNGSFVQILMDNEKKLMADLKEFSIKGVDHKIYNNELFDNFIKLYKKATDKEQRDKDGNTVIKNLVNKVLSVKNYEELQTILVELIGLGLPALISFGVQSDMKNASINALYFGSPSLILPEKGYYDKENPAYAAGQNLLAKYRETVTELLNIVGLKDTSTILSQTLEFDELIVPLSKTSEEASDYVNSYNPYTLEKLNSKTNFISLSSIVKTFVSDKVEQVIVTNPKFVEGLDALLNNHLELIKSWLAVKLVYSLAVSGFGTDSLRLKASEYGLLLTGQAEAQSFEKFTYNQLSNEFGDVVGTYFGKRYFGEKAKKEVESMVQEFIQVYKERLAKITWLSKETIEKALIKLSKITAMIGYPDRINPVFNHFNFDETKSFVDNMLAFSKVQVSHEFSLYGKKVDKDLWHMGAHVVNAYYQPMNNQIVFPAGILQPPFYSYNQTKGANYGGIGAVIAHEITHAFDTNGARIDEFGNINNWWKEEDFKAFNERSLAMIELFDGLEVPGSDAKCNGKLTVTENIADAAGLSCAYEAGLKHKDFVPADFFAGWAHIWRFKANKSYLELLANVDVHSPAYLRGLVQLKNFKPFADYYKLKETDGMYIAPDKQVAVW